MRPEQWQLWARAFLPAAEPFFVTDARVAAALSAAGEVVYTRAELADSFPRFRVDHGIAYRMGAVDGGSFVWLAGRDARDRIDPSLWVAVRDGQGTNGRGQVYDGSWPLPTIAVPDADRLPGGRFLLAPDTWRALGEDVQRAWLREWISGCLADDGLAVDRLGPGDAEVAPPYREVVGRYANTFADTGGANCFAATLGMALGRPRETFPLWLHQEPFLRALRASGFAPAGEGEPRPGDAVVWASATGIPVHAAFCVADGLMFNKYGQGWEQPYALVPLDDLRDFDGTLAGGGTMTVYRPR